MKSKSGAPKRSFARATARRPEAAPAETQDKVLLS